MIIDLSKSYVPESYRDSRDFRVLLKQLSMLLTVFKSNAEDFVNIYNPESCALPLLPCLASMTGYRYQEELSAKRNREIIKYFPYLVRNRGSETGIKLATALSISTDPRNDQLYPLSMILVSVDYEKGLITVQYPGNANVINWDLIEVVRPVGMRVEFVKYEGHFSKDTLRLKILAQVRGNIQESHNVDDSSVGYESITQETYPQEEEEEFEEEIEEEVNNE